MEKEKDSKIGYLLEHKEISIIKHCLNYSWHRCIKHKYNLLERFDVKDLDKLRKEFNKLED